jgi:hypothetical protein
LDKFLPIFHCSDRSLFVYGNHFFEDLPLNLPDAFSPKCNILLVTVSYVLLLLQREATRSKLIEDLAAITRLLINI